MALCYYVLLIEAYVFTLPVVLQTALRNEDSNS
jgi:hypothetical protein